MERRNGGIKNGTALWQYGNDGNEGFIRVLGDLMAQNKGFQIMITVPSDKSRECEKKAVKEHRKKYHWRET